MSPPRSPLVPIDRAAVERARAALPVPELLAIVVEAFEALADPTRARLLYALIGSPLSVRDLAIVAGASESAVSHQLRLLRDRRLVVSTRDGKVVRYAVGGEHLQALFREAEYYADHIHQGLPPHAGDQVELDSP